MKEHLLGLVLQYKTLTINSPYRETEKSDKVLSYYEFCLGLEQIKLERTEKQIRNQDDSKFDTRYFGKIDRELKEFRRRNFGSPSLGIMHNQNSFQDRAKAHAESLVGKQKELWAVSIISSVKSFLRSQIVLGKVSEEVMEEIEKISHRKNSVNWAEAVLYLLGVVSLKATGTYTPLIEDKEPIGIQKIGGMKTEPEEEEEDESAL